MQIPHLGKLLLRLYSILGEESPNRTHVTTEPTNEQTTRKTQELLGDEISYSSIVQSVLEANGWFRTRGYHWAWKNLGYNVANEIVLHLNHHPLLNQWDLHVAFFAPWPTDWNTSMKFGYLKALDLDPKFEEIDLYWGRPVCILRISPRLAEISLWQPQLLSDKLRDILTQILKELPEGLLLADPNLRFRESGWYGFDALKRIAFAAEQAWKESDPLYLQSRQCLVHKVVTDTNVSYVLFSRGSDRFESETFDSPEAIAAEAVRLNYGETHEAYVDAALNTPIVHDLRHDNIHDAVLYCSELKLGNALTPEKARVVQEFYRFLAALIEHGTEGYEELDTYMKATFRELRLKLDEDGDWRDITYHATDLTFGDTYRDKVRTMPPEKISTTRKRKLAGRYVSKLAMIANIAGTDRLAVHEIIQKFCDRPMTMEETAPKFGIVL